MNTLLQELLLAHGPSGQEDEIRDVVQAHVKKLNCETWIDPAGNLIAKFKGKNPDKPAIRLMAHLDEIAMIVKRVHDDGSLRVDPLGGLYPNVLGQCPVEVLGDNKTIGGALSFGSVHTTTETPIPNKMLPRADSGKNEPLTWEDVRVITRLTPETLKSYGVHAGTRVVVAKCQRNLFTINDCIAGYFFDNRASIAACLMALEQLKGAPEQDIYFVASVSEEIGVVGASYAARTLPGDLTIAVDVGPVAKEYQTVLSSDPILVYQDACSLYDRASNTRFMQLAKEHNIPLQTAIFSNYGSDASLAQLRGQTAKAALLCFPVENTHGYEIMHKDALNKVAKLLALFLQ
ncbi:MAG: hypothetical protein LLF94_04360 [Chlamydiales bacterium]|nr:hypothetical protein [Chlamydiales bacterium]